MEDAELVELYWQRSESAIEKTEEKYGGYCYRISIHILSVQEDAEECVSDAYFQAWRSIPPEKPARFGVWLGKVVRNCALNLWNRNHRQKRYNGMAAILEELEDCVPAGETVETNVEARELSALIGRWLRTLKKEDRILFVRRYWNGLSLGELAQESGIAPAALAQRLYRLRSKLKAALEKEGVNL
jgi:RNA polymerase sigma factor (sigma-70 family)